MILKTIKKIVKMAIGQQTLSRMHKLLTYNRNRHYQKKLIKMMRNPLAEPQESFLPYENEMSRLRSEAIENTYNNDRLFMISGLLSCAGITPDMKDVRPLILDLPSNIKLAIEIMKDKNSLGPLIDQDGYKRLPELFGQSYEVLKEGLSISDFLSLFLNRLINCEHKAPRFFEFDHIDDIHHIILSRYSSGQLSDLKRGETVIIALRKLIGQPDCDEFNLKTELKKLISPNIYTPLRSVANNHVRTVIPEYFDEFCNIRGVDDPSRFLELNKLYSERQMNESGSLYARQLSLFRQYENNNLVMIRSIVRLINSKALNSNDRVLIIGPRHLDEIFFFREVLGFNEVVGLDLFASECGSIIQGDMHNMPFSDKHFGLVYMCNTLTYSWNARRVISEILRVVANIGYVLIIDSGTRLRGPDALGRSDMMNTETLIRSFYQRSYKIIIEDPGRSLAPENYAEQPCCLLEISS